MVVDRAYRREGVIMVPQVLGADTLGALRALVASFTPREGEVFALVVHGKLNKQIAFGRAGNFMREILGYAPIEPDGSVSVRVPANVAFVISVLDANGRRLFPAHRNWLQLRPGEVRRCNGCHESTGSHGRDGTFTAVAWSGAPFPATLAATAVSAQPGGGASLRHLPGTAGRARSERLDLRRARGDRHGG